MKIVIVIVIIILFILFSPKVLNTVLKCSPVHLLARQKFIVESEGTFKLINPSIARGNKMMMAIRYTNATMKNLAMYMFQKFNYHSYIGIATVDANFCMQKLVYPNFKSSYPLEDPRIFIYNEIIYVSVTEITNRYIFPVLFELDSSFEMVKRIDYNKNTYKDKHNVQKNWCPFQHKEKLLIHTNAHPTWDVYSVDISTGCMSQITSFSNLFDNFIRKNTYVRCSTSWKEFTPHTYLCGLHIKTYDFIIHKLAVIRTILVEVDKNNLCPIRSTEPFCIDREHHPIQFLAGLETDSENVYLSFGLGDYKSVIYSVTKARINRMLTCCI